MAPRFFGRLMTLGVLFGGGIVAWWLIYRSFGVRGVSIAATGLGLVIVHGWLASLVVGWWGQRPATAPRRVVVVGQYERCMRCRRVLRVDALTLQDDGRKHCPTCDHIVEMEGDVA